MSKRVELQLDVREKPPLGRGVLLSFQHVFAMFGATILVPIMTGYPVSPLVSVLSSTRSLQALKFLYT